MYAAAAPQPAAPTEFPLRLARVVHREFAPGVDSIDDPFSQRHFADLTGGYAVAARSPAAVLDRGNNFTTMTSSLLAEISTGEPIELALVAHATPDMDCRVAAVTYLSEALPGQPLAFGISDCGSAAVFAALRIAGQYAKRHGYHRAAVFVLDQTTMPYRTDRPLAGDSGVALLLTDEDSADRITLRDKQGVDPRDLTAAVSERLAELGVDESTTVVVGPGVGLPAHAGRTVVAAEGFPATGVLAELAGQQGRRVVVDYEPATGELNLCLIERGRP
jgi:hypothetical protein